MIDGRLPASPPAPLAPPRARLGQASFGLALVGLVLAALFFVFAYVLTVNAGQTPSRGAAVAGLVLLVSIGLVSLAGIALGSLALFRSPPRRVYALLGVVFNAVILLAFVLLIVLGLANGTG